jgi:hypothetical protein
MRGRRGRPGLLGVAARTAVVAGTATAVSNRVQRRQDASAQQAADADAYRQQQETIAAEAAAEQAAAQQAAAAPAAPAASGTDDLMASIQRLASLHSQGVLTDEEFSAAKAKLLS